MKSRMLTPFGIELTVDEGTRWESLDVAMLRDLVDRHRVVVLRGLHPLAPHELARASRVLGPLQPWPFGAVHEIVRKPDAENYLYTDHAVPLHWDGAFADEVPHWLVFRCVAAPPEGAAGETIFVDTTRVLEHATAARRASWSRARMRYTTEKKAHYGGSFVSPVVTTHPTLGVPVLRYAEAVDDLNPVTVEALNGPATITDELRGALYDPAVMLTLPWRDGDVVLADNHALLHGRRAFAADAPRHLLRVNVLDDRRRPWRALRDSWRLRRPEFMRAEIPIFLIPAILSATRLSDLTRPSLWEGGALFWLLFQVGDLVNCLLDRDVDLHRKTHLSEAVARLGTRNVHVQIAASGLVALLLAVHLSVTTGRAWMGLAVVVGLLLGAGYTAPPLRLKSRGLAQVGAYIGLLFVGPMTLVSGLVSAWPSPRVLFCALAFGAMQTGSLLVNTAEDLDEDEREGIRTAAVVLGAAGTMRFARVLALVGGLALVVVLGPHLLGLPLGVAILYNEHWLSGLARRTCAVSEVAARALIREQGRRIPRHIELGAWAALLATVALR